MGLKIENSLTNGLIEYKTKFYKNDLLAKKQVAISLLGFVINGSSNNPSIPPIKEGFLRGSGSVFVGAQWISGGESKTDYQNRSGSGTDDNDIITVGFNTPYAARMHEHTGAWSDPDPDISNKFLEKHINSDGKTLVNGYAEFLKQNLHNGS